MILCLGIRNHWPTKILTNGSKTYEKHKITAKTIGQSHKNHEQNSEITI